MNKLQYWTIIYRNTFTGVFKSKTILGLEWRVITDNYSLRHRKVPETLIFAISTSSSLLVDFAPWLWKAQPSGLDRAWTCPPAIEKFSPIEITKRCLCSKRKKCTTILSPDQQTPHCVQPQTWQQPLSTLRRCAGLPAPYKVNQVKTLLWLRKLPRLLGLPYFHLAHRLTRHSRQVSTVSESQSTS